MPDTDYLTAHKYSIRHREQILRSEICGCFCCLRTFAPADISDWIDKVDGIGQTALCPFCHIDSVIGSATGYPITTEFLSHMEVHWFGILNRNEDER